MGRLPAAGGREPERMEGGFDAIVLAGGRGSRLGGAGKPDLVVAGQPLIASVVTAAAAAGAQRVVVVGPDRPGWQVLRPAAGGSTLRLVQEQPPEGGPVPALRRGLAEAGAPLIVLLAADLPFLLAPHLRTLLRAAAAQQAGAVLADDTGRPQWLLSCWRREELARAAAGYRGDSLRGLLAPLAPAVVRLELPPGSPPPWLDCDTPADLARAREWAGRAG